MLTTQNKHVKKVFSFAIKIKYTNKERAERIQWHYMLRSIKHLSRLTAECALYPVLTTETCFQTFLNAK